MSQSGLILAGKPRQPYCFHWTRAALISMEEDISLVWRKALHYAGRHFISMQEDREDREDTNKD